MECDAFSAMSCMDNTREMFCGNEYGIGGLGFLPGDGALHWYLVNWSLGDHVIKSNEIGTILI